MIAEQDGGAEGATGGPGMLERKTKQKHNGAYGHQVHLNTTVFVSMSSEHRIVYPVINGLKLLASPPQARLAQNTHKRNRAVKRGFINDQSRSQMEKALLYDMKVASCITAVR